MKHFYPKYKKRVVTESKNYPGIRIAITRSPASFSIKVYKGKYKISQVYRSPYQRKFEGYYNPDKSKMEEFAPLELIAFEIIESQEPIMMEEYEIPFKECLEKYPKPSTPIKTEI